MTIRSCLFAVLLFGMLGNTYAVDIVDEHKDAPKVSTANGITSIEMPTGWTYTVAEVPASAVKLQAFTTPPPQFAKGKNKAALDSLTFGEDLTRDEAVAALDAYFREIAFDYDSVKLRKLDVTQRTYVAWCSNYLITCLEWQFRAGTWTSFEMNGRNRNGGMTGFQPEFLLLRKVKSGAVAGFP